ncbi:hypothetical protein [Paenibacillus senegalensis]|uniref:hypothetical protein n=1 Tax=Paenibacillus senegalensis TaxID=1465766 RepID=UPI000289AE2F|nr:hypothetical protein [Paenibacillus senegalensis]
MTDPKEEYKELIREAARIAAKGGVISTDFEDFLIDHLDEIVDNLSENQFDHLLRNGKIPVEDIKDDQEYDQTLKRAVKARKLLEAGSVTPFDFRRLRHYEEGLQELTETYKEREWER